MPRRSARIASSFGTVTASQNALLCQLTADAAGRHVIAGPVEATALGNLLIQARTHGVLSGDLGALRKRVRAAVRLQSYEPRR